MNNFNAGTFKAITVIVAVLTFVAMFFLPFFSVTYGDSLNILPEYRGETVELSYFTILTESSEVGGFGFLEIIALFSAFAVIIFTLKNSFTSARNFAIVGIIGVVCVLGLLSSMGSRTAGIEGVGAGIGAILGVLGYVALLVVAIITNKKQKEYEKSQFAVNYNADPYQQDPYQQNSNQQNSNQQNPYQQ